jgi:ABC-2 type transport system permease protein
MEARPATAATAVSPLPAEDVSPARLRRLSYLSLFWLAARECLRVGRLWSQTVLAPVVSSLLFVIVFGLSLGDRIRQVSGFDYEVFILPGLVAMAMFMAAYMNNSSSIFQARSDRYIDDILAAPMLPWQIDVGLTVGGVFRALLIGGALTSIGAPLLGVPIERPLALAAAALAAILLFASLGVIVGIHAQTWDHHSFVSNLVIQPLAFVGGVFYSVEILSSPWQELTHANPLFYIVDAVRYGFLGTSDVPIGLSLGITAALAAAMFSWSAWLFHSGHKLKP